MPDTEKTTLADKLNKYGAFSEVEKGQVTVEFAPKDEHLTADGSVPGGSELDRLSNGVKGYLGAHPYGSAGGYVVWAEFEGEKSFYDANGECCWL